MALTAVPAADAAWSVPLGVGSATEASGRRGLRLESLQPDPTDRTFTRVWIQPEDDRPDVRDRLVQLGHRAALLPAQIVVAESTTAGLSDVLASPNLLLCSAAEASGWGLHWRRVAGVELARGFDLSTGDGDDPGALEGPLWAAVAACLGATAVTG